MERLNDLETRKDSQPEEAARDSNVYEGAGGVREGMADLKRVGDANAVDTTSKVDFRILDDAPPPPEESHIRSPSMRSNMSR